MKELAAAISSIFLRLRFGWLRMWSGIRCELAMFICPSTMMNGMLLFELISAESSGLLGLTPRSRNAADQMATSFCSFSRSWRAMSLVNSSDEMPITRPSTMISTRLRNEKRGYASPFFMGGVICARCPVARVSGGSGPCWRAARRRPAPPGRAEPSGVPRRHNSGSA